MNYMIYK